MSQVWGKDIAGTKRDVLLIYCDYANDEGFTAWPTVRKVAWKAGISPRQAQRTIKQLRGMGVFELAAPHYGQREGMRYRINLNALPNKPPFQTGDTQMSGGRVTQLCQGTGDTQMSPKPSVTINQPLTHTPTVTVGEASISVMATNVANAASLESESEPKVTVARLDAVTDLFNHATKPKTAATVIRKWKLPAHLEDLCITFAEVFGIEADGPNKTLSNTKQTKGKWLRGATELAELNPTHAELIKARDIARANRYPIAHPGAAVNTITNLRQSARQTKPPVLTHPQPVTFREVTSHDDE